MKNPQIIFRNMPYSDFVYKNIEKKAKNLQHFFPNIMTCKVSAEAPHHHHHRGNLYRVRIDIRVPDRELVTNRGKTRRHDHENIYVAIRDAFERAKRLLQNHASRRRGRVKYHQPPSHGKVEAVFPHMDYGTIVTADRGPVYFHRHSLLNGTLENLHAGTELRFNLQQGLDGPQASCVRIIGKHHPVNRPFDKRKTP